MSSLQLSLLPFIVLVLQAYPPSCDAPPRARWGLADVMDAEVEHTAWPVALHKWLRGSGYFYSSCSKLSQIHMTSREELLYTPRRCHFPEHTDEEPCVPTPRMEQDVCHNLFIPRSPS